MLKLFINKQPIMKCVSAYLIKYSHAYRNFDALRENENVKRVERQTFEKKLEFILCLCVSYDLKANLHRYTRGIIMY